MHGRTNGGNLRTKPKPFTWGKKVPCNGLAILSCLGLAQVHNTRSSHSQPAPGPPAQCFFKVTVRLSGVSSTFIVDIFFPKFRIEVIKINLFFLYNDHERFLKTHVIQSLRELWEISFIFLDNDRHKIY